MSFTLTYRKDGREIPIKMSIWDAFRGVPDSKSMQWKGRECPCCGKRHGSGTGKATGGSKVVKYSQDKNAEVEFSTEDDNLILKMKNDNASWKAILIALGKGSKSNVQARYKELKKLQYSSDQSKDQGPSDGGTQDRNQGNASKGDGKAGKKGTEHDLWGKTDEAGLSTWAEGYDRKKWLAVASKHYDMTGQRISADQARKMAAGK